MIEKLLFLIFTFTSIFLYYFWSSGYLPHRTKILLFFSFLGALFSYFILYDFLITVNDSIELILEKLFFFILLSISSIFLIISITIPSENPISKEAIVKILKSNELKRNNNNQTKKISLQIKKEDSDIYIKNDFQGFLNHLFEEQAK